MQTAKYQTNSQLRVLAISAYAEWGHRVEDPRGLSLQQRKSLVACVALL